jgi:hypothetical protein
MTYFGKVEDQFGGQDEGSGAEAKSVVRCVVFGQNLGSHRFVIRAHHSLSLAERGNVTLFQTLTPDLIDTVDRNRPFLQP